VGKDVCYHVISVIESEREIRSIIALPWSNQPSSVPMQGQMNPVRVLSCLLKIRFNNFLLSC
jgi:hypothetical protein